MKKRTYKPIVQCANCLAPVDDCTCPKPLNEIIVKCGNCKYEDLEDTFIYCPICGGKIDEHEWID